MVLDEEEKDESLYNSLSLTKVERLQPFMRKPKFPKDGWNVYDIRKEFARQGVKNGKRFKYVTCWSSKNSYIL